MLPWLLSLGYLVLVAASIAIVFLPGAGNLSGVYAVILTLPWSALAVVVLDWIDPGLNDRGWGVVATAVGGLLNAAGIYFFFRRGLRSTE